MARVGMDGKEASVLESLITQAWSLYSGYVIPGRPLPHDKVQKLQDQANPEDRKERYLTQKSLRQTIGEKAMRGEFTVLNRDASTTIKHILCGRRDGRILSMILELTKTLNFTLGGYNLKEMTSLALRADRWLEEMMGRKNPEEIAARRRVTILRGDLINFLANTNEENYLTVLRSRENRAMEILRKDIAAELLESEPQARQEELEARRSEINKLWEHLRQTPIHELILLEEAEREIPKYERSFKRFEQRLEKRRKEQAKAENKLGRQLTEEECAQYRISDDEEKWRREEEVKLKKLLRRRQHADFTWSAFSQNQLADVDRILAAHNRLKELELQEKV